MRLLLMHGIEAVADVRSTPYSRRNLQYDRDILKSTLKSVDIAYVFLGKELGARSDDPRCYRNGKVDYELLARTEAFQSGLERVRKGAEAHRVALMCAEKDPLDCHRTILVARKLAEQGLPVTHILSDGSLETHDDAMSRLLKMLHIGERDFFRSREEALREAYKERGEAIAYEEQTAPTERRAKAQ
jgi:uncharacterized protein (DUF488 family)